AAQPQKHWVQAMLNADTYVPVRQTYDITGWSLPLLGDIPGGSSGRAATPDATPGGVAPDPAWTLDAPAGVDVAIFESTLGVYALEGARPLSWGVDDGWGVPDAILAPPHPIGGGAHADVAVLVRPSGGSISAIRRLGEDGVRELKRWVRNGGHFVGYRY